MYLGFGDLGIRDLGIRDLGFRDLGFEVEASALCKNARMS